MAVSICVVPYFCCLQPLSFPSLFLCSRSINEILLEFIYCLFFCTQCLVSVMRPTPASDICGGRNQQLLTSKVFKSHGQGLFNTNCDKVKVK